MQQLELIATAPSNQNGHLNGASPGEQYLIGKTGKLKAHIWRDGDTVCRMWSTGGLKQSSYEVATDRGTHEICCMCSALHAPLTNDQTALVETLISRASAPDPHAF